MCGSCSNGTIMFLWLLNIDNSMKVAWNINIFIYKTNRPPTFVLAYWLSSTESDIKYKNM